MSMEEKIKEIRKTNINCLRNAHNEFYSARNLKVSVIGDFDKNNILKLIKSSFADKKFNTFFERVYPEFIQNKNKEKILYISGKEMSVIIISFNFLMSESSKNYSAVKIINYIFGESMDSRLMLRLREKEGLSYSCGSWMNSIDKIENSNFNMYAICSSSNYEKTKKCMIEELNKLIKNGIFEKELIDNIKSFRSYFYTLMSDDNKLSDIISDNLVKGRSFVFYQKIINKMSKLKTKDVNCIISKLFSYKNLSIVIAGDIKK